ncbi:hypothetical protein LG274_02700 [Micrococcus antarcticus]|uniref:hypothetical protein n=1 Tax=Micrococcus antarcticus TaxID=86171 RepID=UPI00384F988A
MLRRAGMALWADLHAAGIDLWSVLDGEGPHSAAEALAVAEALPDTTRTAAALAGDVSAFGWGVDRELMVALLNGLRGEKGEAFKSPLALAHEARQREERIDELSTPEAVLALLG